MLIIKSTNTLECEQCKCEIPQGTLVELNTYGLCPDGYTCSSCAALLIAAEIDRLTALLSILHLQNTRNPKLALQHLSNPLTSELAKDILEHATE